MVAADEIAVKNEISAYVRSRPVDIGEPVDNGGGVAAHQLDGLWVQDFAGRGESAQSTRPGALGRVLVVVGPAGPKLVRNDFYNHYLDTTGGTPTHVVLGAPLEEEHPNGAEAIQAFERGRMVWDPATGTTI